MPRRLIQLFSGLVLYGISDSMLRPAVADEEQRDSLDASAVS